MSIGSLGLTMEEIQRVIADASEQTPEMGPDGAEMGDPEYVTAYMLNIVIPLLQYNNLRIEEQLAAIGIRIPTKEQILDALAQQQAAQAAQLAASENDEYSEYSDMVMQSGAMDDDDTGGEIARATEMHAAADTDDGLPPAATDEDDDPTRDAHATGSDRL